MLINNNDYQKNSNLSRIFEAIWRKPGISRVDISRSLHLYRSTTSNIIDELLANNIIYEGNAGESSSAGGRRPVCLFPNKLFGCYIGIELEPEYYHLTAVDITGKPLQSVTGPIPVNEKLLPDPEQSFIWTIDSIMQQSAEALNTVTTPILGICMGLPGIIDIKKRIILKSNPFSLVNFDYGTVFENRYNLPFFMENDANCCAWLQTAAPGAVQTALTILTKNYGNENKLNYPGNYTNSTGIGIAITLEGKIQYGKNYSAGEYISQSWRAGSKGQTGLPEAVLTTILKNEDSYVAWVRDFFSTLTTFIPLISPDKVYLHGQPDNKHEFLKQTVKSEVPQFYAAVEKMDSEFVIMKEDVYEVAKGAALMMIQKMFIIPSFEGVASKDFINWNSCFALQKENKPLKIQK